jgi:superfamily II DNA helicase RecQ
MYFSSEFQNVLALIVVDEAHMIYLWGLVASKQSKTISSFDRYQDRATFCPSYGCMATRLMATINAPLLLLSATCRPIAVEAIRKNLWLQPQDLTIVNGELTRPEIRLIRISMQSTLKSCDDLLRLYAPYTKVLAEEIVPTIIYSGTQNATLQVMKVVNEARHTKLHEYNPQDWLIRRYHSCTGEEDQIENMADYSNDEFPIMSATKALGLGQNLKRV